MYDTGKVLSGLAIFVAIMTSPIWYNLASGKGSYRPTPQLPTQEARCVEDAKWMKEWHMDMLDQWRHEVLRYNQRTYCSSDGRLFDKSLTNTCLSCHSNKAQFCDQCHNYAGVKPFCWDCHLTPEDVGR